MEVFHKAKAIAASFQRTNGFLKSFLVVFTNGHDLAYSLHLCTQLILGAFEFFKCPTCKFNYNIISGRFIFIQSSFFPVWNFIESQSCCKKGRYISDWESCCFTCKSRGTGGSRIDFNNYHTVRYRVMGKLYVCTADNTYRFYNGMRLFFQTILQFL